MTDYVEETNEEQVYDFIAGTCLLLPQPYHDPSDHMHNLVASADSRPNQYFISCGSHKEFYIEPLNTCIDDIDVLIAPNDKLVFSGCDLKLPSDMSGLSDAIMCFKIEPYDKYPGFVRLKVCGKMRYNWKSKNYEFNSPSLTNVYLLLNVDGITNELQGYTLLNSIALPDIVSGPAIKHRRDTRTGYIPSVDFVKSIACSQWPTEAKGWIKRPRINGWPKIDTVHEVVRSGCHVVYVQHRSCRDDDEQWRLSFSLAEVILIQSWTRVQQIVYHLLRFFAKKELIQKDCPKEDEVLCTYHLKTLMLWSCEEMSSEWWISSSVITICSVLLKKLADWLQKRQCPNYFIPEANLFHMQTSTAILEKTERRIANFCNPGILTNWFMENYIMQIIRKYFKSRSAVEVMPPHLVGYMLGILEFWKAKKIASFDLNVYAAFAESQTICRPIIKQGYSSGLKSSLIVGNASRCHDAVKNEPLNYFPAIQNLSCSTYYGQLLHIMHTAYGLDCEEISWDGSLFVEFVNDISSQPKMIRSLYHNFPKAYNAQSNRFLFLRAQNLMQNLTGSNSRPEFQLLYLMSKQFLRKALDNDVSKPNEIASAALVYLAALHFATSEYQQAIRLCLEVLVDPNSVKDKETLNAGCLLFIDDIARIVGLCVLQKKMTNNILHNDCRRLFLDLRLSPEVFAHYLIVLSAERLYTHSEFYYNLPNAEFPMDEYLMALLKSKCVASTKFDTQINPVRHIVYLIPDSVLETESVTVNHLNVKDAVILVLMEYALENMTSFYDVLRIDSGIKCHTVNCYRALYLYKCQKYDQVMQLCEQILEEPDLQTDLMIFTFANVLLMPPLDFFFDRDVQSLLGLHTLFYYLSPFNYGMETVEPSEELGFEHRFAQFINHHKCGLMMFIQFHYTVKRHYFIGRRFLARYLKVRCFIDCNLPYSESLAEFAVHKNNLPFEHIIRSFLLQRLR